MCLNVGNPKDNFILSCPNSNSIPLKLTLTLTRGIHTTTELACITSAQRRRRHVFTLTHSGKRQADLEYARRCPGVYSDVHGVHEVARPVPVQPNIGGTVCESSVIPFLLIVPRRKVWLTPAAGVPCSNAANIGERKIWT